MRAICLAVLALPASLFGCFEDTYDTGCTLRGECIEDSAADVAEVDSAKDSTPVDSGIDTADSVADSFDGGPADADADTRVCDPGATKCDGASLDVCSSDGARWTTQHCISCAAGKCLRVVDLSANSGQFTCALLSDDTVRCWGDSQNGATAASDRSVPTVKPTSVVGVSTVKQVATGTAVGLALLNDGTVKAWGITSSVPSLTVTDVITLPEFAGADEVAAGNGHLCGRFAGGVMCSGLGTFGQLGDSKGTASATKVTVSGLTGATRLFVGGYESFASTASDVRGWGHNTFGQMGVSLTTDQYVPAVTYGLATQIAAEDEHTCAVLSTGDVRCAGHNTYGQLGDGSKADRSSPTTVVGLGAVAASQVVVGAFHTCALLKDGTAKCWGANFDGQLGDGTTGPSTSPITVVGLVGAKKIVGGLQHNCAVVDEGADVKCWGSNRYGQIGDGTTGPTVPRRLTVTSVVW